MCDQHCLRSACAYAQSDQSLCKSLEYSLIVKLLTEHYLEFLSLKRGCRGSSESIHVKMSHCWKAHALAHFFYLSHPHMHNELLFLFTIKFRTSILFSKKLHQMLEYVVDTFTFK